MMALYVASHYKNTPNDLMCGALCCAVLCCAVLCLRCAVPGVPRCPCASGISAAGWLRCDWCRPLLDDAFLTISALPLMQPDERRAGAPTVCAAGPGGRDAGKQAAVHSCHCWSPPPPRALQCTPPTLCLHCWPTQSAFPMHTRLLQNALPDVLAVVQVALEGAISRRSVQASLAAGQLPQVRCVLWPRAGLLSADVHGGCNAGGGRMRQRRICCCVLSILCRAACDSLFHGPAAPGQPASVVPMQFVSSACLNGFRAT